MVRSSDDFWGPGVEASADRSAEAGPNAQLELDDEDNVVGAAAGVSLGPGGGAFLNITDTYASR